MAQLIFRPVAEQDLDDIWFYIAQDNVEAADRTLDLLRDKCLLLSQSPMIGRSRPELAPRLRSFPMGHYLIFYCPIESGVEVVRILQGAQNLDSIEFSTTLQ